MKTLLVSVCMVLALAGTAAAQQAQVPQYEVLVVLVNESIGAKMEIRGPGGQIEQVELKQNGNSGTNPSHNTNVIYEAFERLYRQGWRMVGSGTVGGGFGSRYVFERPRP